MRRDDEPQRIRHAHADLLQRDAAGKSHEVRLRLPAPVLRRMRLADLLVSLVRPGAVVEIVEIVEHAGASDRTRASPARSRRSAICPEPADWAGPRETECVRSDDPRASSRRWTRGSRVPAVA